MSTNTTYSFILTLRSLGLSDAFVYPAFFLATLTYLFIMSCNLTILATITFSKSMHKPMYILLFNLPISDMVGATAFFPQLALSIVTQNRQISHSACITQAFFIHFYGSGNLLILSAMAYDRYVAICCPLRYSAIMTPRNLVKMIILIWVTDFSLIFTLFFLLIRFKFCRMNLVDFFCNNPSLLKLVCADTRLNDYYGLIVMGVLQGGPLILMIYTYARILHTCITTNRFDAWQKALQTCGTHLVIYLLLQINTFVTLLAHRMENLSPYMRRVLGVSILVFPPLFDPIVYGLKTKELKQNIKIFLKMNPGSSQI